MTPSNRPLVMELTETWVTQGEGVYRRHFSVWTGGEIVKGSFREAPFCSVFLPQGAGTTLTYQIHQHIPVDFDFLESRSSKFSMQDIINAVHVLDYTHGFASANDKIAIVNSIQSFGKIAQHAISVDRLRIPELPAATDRLCLTNRVYFRHDRSKYQPQAMFSLLSRHIVDNFEKRINSEKVQGNRMAMRSEEEQYALRVYRSMIEYDRVRTYDASQLEMLGFNTMGWAKRALSALLPKVVDDSLDEYKLLRLLQAYGTTDMESRDAIGGLLNADDFLYSNLSSEFDKTQYRARLLRRLFTMWVQDFCSMHPVLKPKGNQPVMIANASMTMFAQETVRAVSAILVAGFNESVFIGSTPGVQPREFHHYAFGGIEPELKESLFWVELDVQQSDSSHFRALFVFISLLLHHMAPSAKFLHAAWGALLHAVSHHWRARNLATKQKADFWAVLMSGTAWTFLANSLFVLMLATGDHPDYLKALVGGDNATLAFASLKALKFKRAEYFGVTMKIERISSLYTTFLGILVSRFGAFPDLLKCAAKVIDRRYNKDRALALVEIEAYQVSVKDQLACLHDADSYGNAVGLTALANEMSYDAADLACRFLIDFAFAPPERVFKLCISQSNIVLESISFTAFDGGYFSFV
jgi:hypothetical protein